MSRTIICQITTHGAIVGYALILLMIRPLIGILINLCRLMDGMMFLWLIPFRLMLWLGMVVLLRRRLLIRRLRLLLSSCV